jgi:hypothetical protein
MFAPSYASRQDQNSRGMLFMCRSVLRPLPNMVCLCFRVGRRLLQQLWHPCCACFPHLVRLYCCRPVYCCLVGVNLCCDGVKGGGGGCFVRTAVACRPQQHVPSPHFFQRHSRAGFFTRTALLRELQPTQPWVCLEQRAGNRGPVRSTVVSWQHVPLGSARSTQGSLRPVCAAAEAAGRCCCISGVFGCGL